MSYERPSHTPASTDCPTCLSHAAVFRAHLAGSRFYCARCRKTFNTAYQESHSTAFSLGPAAGGSSLADTIAFVPDTKPELDICIEPIREPFPIIRFVSLTARRRARPDLFWLGLVLAISLGLVAILAITASRMCSRLVVERPARELLR